MALPQEQDKVYTIVDINNLPENTFAELINGQVYMQASPSSIHQRISKNANT